MYALDYNITILHYNITILDYNQYLMKTTWLGSEIEPQSEPQNHNNVISGKWEASMKENNGETTYSRLAARIRQLSNHLEVPCMGCKLNFKI